MERDEFFQLGSETAKAGFNNEFDVVLKFNNWIKDKDAQEWLTTMGYKLEEIQKVEAVKVPGSYKADIQAKIKIYLKDVIDAQNISVKLVGIQSTSGIIKGKNQTDKRAVKKYIEMWDIPEDIGILLEKFCGVIKPEDNCNLRDKRRLFIDEMSIEDQNKIINFFNDNKIMVVTDILKGRGQFAAEWMLVTHTSKKTKDTPSRWVLKPMNVVMNYYSQGKVQLSPRGSLNIGKIGMQRKGGDNGRETAKYLQFNIDPGQLFYISNDSL